MLFGSSLLDKVVTVHATRIYDGQEHAHYIYIIFETKFPECVVVLCNNREQSVTVTLLALFSANIVECPAVVKLMVIYCK